MKKSILTTIIFTAISTFSFSQRIEKKLTLTALNNKSIDTILKLNGTLDAKNTLTRLTNGISRAFQPLKKIKISNVGTTTIINPHFIVNQEKNWYSFSSMQEEIFRGSTTTKEKFLSLWDFSVKNRFHNTPAETGEEQHDPIKLFSVYGYGICDDLTRTEGSLAINSKGFDLWDLNVHVIPDINIDDDNAILDADTEVFYLNLDNDSLADFNQVLEDRYLIARTHHYGEASDNPDWMDKVLATFYGPPKSKVNYPTVSKTLHTLDYKLRPGESIIFDNTIQSPEWHEYNSSSLLTNKPISNGKLELNAAFGNTSLSELFDTTINIVTQSTYLTLNNSITKGEFILKTASPFVLLDGLFKVHASSYSLTDSISLFFSRDGDIWQEIASSTIDNLNNELLELTSFIASKSSPALYTYFVKVKLTSLTPANLKIDSLFLSSGFQVSNFFLPDLKLGDNSINYSDSNTSPRSVQIDLTYQETSENTPPLNNILTAYPADGAILDKNQFQFEWTVPTDPDGDKIIDYEFELSDRADMKYPLSPNFKRYMSAVYKYYNLDVIPPAYFLIWPGLLNSNTTYYWRVRAKDSKNTWGNWSKIFKFTPQTVMPPVNPTIETSQDSIIIKWKPNDKGTTPTKFVIYGSNEDDGFVPLPTNKISTIDTNYFVLRISDTTRPNAFYRIEAVSDNGTRSAPTKVLKTPYPIIFYNADTVIANTPYKVNIYPTNLYTINYNLATEAIDTLRSKIEITPIQLPDWLTYDAATYSLSGTIDSATALRIPYDSSLSYISLSIQDKQFNKSSSYNFTILGQDINHPPTINKEDTIFAFVNRAYTDSLKALDLDGIHGDIIKFQLINKPSWLQSVKFENNTIYLSGTPIDEDQHEDSLSFKIYDRRSSKKISIPVLVYSSPLSAFSSNVDSLCRGTSAMLIISTHFTKDWTINLKDDKSNTYTLDNQNTNEFKLSVYPQESTTYSIEKITYKGHTFTGFDEQVTINMRPTHEPQLLPLQDTTIIPDASYTIQISATDGDLLHCSDTLVYDLQAYGDWLSFNSKNGTLVFTPTKENIGEYIINYGVTDAQGHHVTDSFKLIISLPPTIISQPVEELTVNQKYYYDISISNGVEESSLPLPDIKIEVLDKPSWLKFDSSKLVLTGTPRSNNVGTYEITLKIENEFGQSDTQTFKINVIDKSFNSTTRIKALVFPNPVQQCAIIQYVLDSKSKLKIDLVDIQGRQIERILDATMNKGAYHLKWDKKYNLSAGIYLLRFSFEYIDTGKRYTESIKLIVTP